LAIEKRRITQAPVEAILPSKRVKRAVVYNCRSPTSFVPSPLIGGDGTKEVARSHERVDQLIFEKPSE